MHYGEQRPGAYVRPVAVGANFLAAHAVTWGVAPSVAVVVAIIELVLAVTVIVTALFAPDKFSDRAFRLLRPKVGESGSISRAPKTNNPVRRTTGNDPH